MSEGGQEIDGSEGKERNGTGPMEGMSSLKTEVSESFHNCSSSAETTPTVTSETASESVDLDERKQELLLGASTEVHDGQGFVEAARVLKDEKDENAVSEEKSCLSVVTGKEKEGNTMTTSTSFFESASSSNEEVAMIKTKDESDHDSSKISYSKEDCFGDLSKGVVESRDASSTTHGDGMFLLPQGSEVASAHQANLSAPAGWNNAFFYYVNPAAFGNLGCGCAGGCNGTCGSYACGASSFSRPVIPYEEERRESPKTSAGATARYNRGDIVVDRKCLLVRGWLDRPARVQVENSKDGKNGRSYRLENCNEYNIWYGKYLTDRYNNYGDNVERAAAATRCLPERDCGYTRADKDGADSDYICVYFAKGCCAYGKECRYRHILPTYDDEVRLEVSKDIFGRDRHRDHKDDMTGVGSFNHECKTLFISGIRLDPLQSDSLVEAEKTLRKEFGLYGDISDLRIIPKKNIAFLTYHHRVQAEFAKIAMADQHIDSFDSILLVKWAHHDGKSQNNNESEKEQLSQTKKRSHVSENSAQPSDVKRFRNHSGATNTSLDLSTMDDKKFSSLLNDVDGRTNSTQLHSKTILDQYYATWQNLLQKQMYAYPCPTQANAHTLHPPNVTQTHQVPYTTPAIPPIYTTTLQNEQ